MTGRKVVLGLGSNLGDRAAFLDRACRRLEELVSNLRRSSVIESAPLGPPQPDYLNQVVVAETELAPEALLEAVKRVEKELGREPTERWGPRPIDIDILALGDLRLDTSELTVPHPEIGRRRFVLEPWAEVDPEFAVPGAGATVRELLRTLEREERPE